MLKKIFMNKLFYLLIVLFSFSSFAKSQNTIFLVTGKKLAIGDFKMNKSDYISYKNKKGKIKSIPKEDVFSISSSTGNEILVYTPDLSDSSSFTIAQMRDYVRGAYDARTNYKTPWIGFAGFMVGGGSVGLTTLGMSSLLVPVLPISYDAGVGIFKMKSKKLKLSENLISNPYYKEGYLNRANRKRMNHAILGTIIGMAAGTVAVIAFVK